MRLLVVYCEVPLGLGRCAAQTTRGCTHYLRGTGGRRLRSGDCGCVVAGAGVSVLSVSGGQSSSSSTSRQENRDGGERRNRTI